MFQKILVYENALADEHPALQRALQLARHGEVALKIVDVVEGDENALHDRHRKMRSLVEQERKDRLDSICAPLCDQGIQFTTELLRGRPFVEIVREVVHEVFHLVIKTASLATPNDVTGVMGPVDLRLVRNCPCPIWLEVLGHEVRSQPILVAIDPQEQDDDLNNVLLKMGSSLAKVCGGELHAVSAWEVPDEDFLMEKLKPEKLKQYTHDLQFSAQQSLDATLAQAGKPVETSNVHFHKGDPARVILDCVESQQPDFLVMGTVGHTNVRGLLVGNTAARCCGRSVAQSWRSNRTACSRA